MKSLVESLFDGDLVSKDTGLEYLYGLVENARVSSDFKIDYFDEKKIKRDFNSITKKFPPKQWSTNPLTGMDVFQKMEMNELLRELLYIITGSIKTTNIPIKSNGKIDPIRFENLLLNIIYDYIDPKYRSYIKVIQMRSPQAAWDIYLNIYFQLGKQWGGHRVNEYAGKISICINTSMLE